MSRLSGPRCIDDVRTANKMIYISVVMAWLPTIQIDNR